MTAATVRAPSAAIATHPLVSPNTALEPKDERIAQLERDREQLNERVEELETETTRLEHLAEAALNKANKERVTGLQFRELEKGAHLQAETVDEHAVVDDRLERLRKADGQAYYRPTDSADPLKRGGDVSLAYGDLLPIQQLARLDEEMRHSTANLLPTRLATKLWQARGDSSVGG